MIIFMFDHDIPSCKYYPLSFSVLSHTCMPCFLWFLFADSFFLFLFVAFPFPNLFFLVKANFLILRCITWLLYFGSLHFWILNYILFCSYLQFQLFKRFLTTSQLMIPEHFWKEKKFSFFPLCFWHYAWSLLKPFENVES